MFTGNHGRSKQVITGNLTRTIHALHCHEVGIRNHVPLFIFSIQTEQILRIHTIFGSSLQHHLVHLPETDEVGRIETPDIGLQSFHRLVHINSQFCRFGQIDPQQILREVRIETGCDTRQTRIGIQLGHKRFGHFVQLGKCPGSLILQTKFETAGITETGNRRWKEELDIRILDMRHAVSIDAHQFLGRLLAFVPRLQVDHPHAKTGSFRFRHQAVACQCGNRFHFFQRQQSGLHFAQSSFRTFESRSGRRIDIHIDHSLVFIRDKTRRQHKRHTPCCQTENNQRRIGQETPVQEQTQIDLITAFQMIVALIESVEETRQQTFLHLFVMRDRLQHQGAECGRQRQGIHARNNNRHRQCQRELPIENTDRTGHKTYRNEHGRHHQSNGNNRPADFTNGGVGGFCRWKFFVVHLHMYRLHHDNSIIDHDTDCQHQCEQCQHIDGEAQHLHKEESPDKRNRNGYRRNQRRTEILQEQIYHDKHQQKGFQQCPEHNRNRSIQKSRNIVRYIIIHSGGKTAFLDFLHLGFDILNHLTGIRTRTLLDHDRGGRLAVGHGNHIIVFRIELNRRHILQPENRTVRQRLQHDLAIFFGSAELPAILQYILQLLRNLIRTDTGLPRSSFDILRTDSGGHLLR